ncbi:hypothetical protein B0J13DRAFT_181388 [Dactylonectria estremocensis]|uniref:F-box domain-containing protein n=1 Tax=Dactylonectria estremocensis TaxID=1079267 RepID=A0A9P9JES5_9HYPO|nr:hypothetical protein B0J13DRAFT_181388 [Dactylonectria estremocensis]
MDRASLGSLPDDLLLDIVECLDTAHDVAHLAASTKRMQHLVRRDGWRTFVKTHFPSLGIPVGAQTRWDAVADRATYLDRSWDRRGFGISVLQEKQQQQQQQRTGRHQRRLPRGQSVTFHAVLDARLSSDLEHEVIAAGVGENLLVRMKPQNRYAPDDWHQLQGKTHGYRAGTGDVTAVSVMERRGQPVVAVGRANGDIQILSAEDDFAQCLQNLTLGNGQVPTDPTRTSPGQLAVSWTEWQPELNLLASCKGSLLALHNLETVDDDTALDAVEHVDFAQSSAQGEASLVRAAKFMSKDVVACALGGTREPLRWAKLTPTGLEFLNAASNPLVLEEAARLTDIRIGEKTAVRAIEPVRGGGSESLLLSAWDDGTYRLMDIRTPSSHDAVYRDSFQPYEAGSSLLVYGTERFVSGSTTAPDIRLFDFRYPKAYHHTSAFTCSTSRPFPFPSQRDGRDAWKEDRSSPLCDFQNGSQCTWHDWSTQDYWRPDATIHIGSPSYDRIYCLSKSSDLSDTVYCGVRGAILEMNLRLTKDAGPAQREDTAPAGWHTERPKFKVSLIETGCSLVQGKERDCGNRTVPELIMQLPNILPKYASLLGEAGRHRLDVAFHRPEDHRGLTI